MIGGTWSRLTGVWCVACGENGGSRGAKESCGQSAALIGIGCRGEEFEKGADDDGARDGGVVDESLIDEGCADTGGVKDWSMNGCHAE